MSSQPSQTTPPELQKAFNRFEAGDLSGGVAIIRSQADKGETNAIYALGMVYLNGVQVEHNITKAIELISKAADCGHTAAMITLSELYATGNGVTPNLDKAIDLCEKAALAGDAEGNVNIGLIHEHGHFGVQKDPSLAAKYYEKACIQKSTYGMFLLGRLYLNGIGVEKDPARAFQLYEEVASTDDRNFRNVEDTHAIFALVMLCMNGNDGHPIDRTRGYKLLRRLARWGHNGAREDLEQFPEIVKMGQIVISPGITRLSPADRGALVKRHAVGNWGDISPEQWDMNDRELASGGGVISIHRFPDFSVIISTPPSSTGNQGSYMELEGEEIHFKTDFVKLFKYARKAYSVYSFLKDYMHNN